MTIGRRLTREAGFCLLVILAATWLMFLAGRLMPQAGRERLLQEGFVQPWNVQYLLWWKNILLYQDLGSSLKNGDPVREVVLRRAGVTMLLTFGAMLVTIGLAATLGAGYAFRRHSRSWKFLNAFFDTLSSLPAFVTAYLWILFFLLCFKIIPTNPYQSQSVFVWIGEFALMALVLGIADGNLGEMARFIRTEIRDLLDKEFTLALRARGIPLGKHILRNAFIPVFSLLMDRTAYFLSGAVIIEKVFSLQGLGLLALDSVEARDYPMLWGLCLVMVLMVLVCHFISEMATSLISPYRD